MLVTKIHTATFMQIGTATAIKEKVVRGALKVAQYDPGNRQIKNLEVPVFIAQGKEEEPKILILGGFSGLDVISTYSLYRFVEEMEPKDLSGTLIILPIINIAGYYASSKIQPFDGKMIENSFPGSLDSTVSEQIAATLMEQVIANVDLVVYLQDEEGWLSTEPYVQMFGPDEMVKENDIAMQKAAGLGTEILEVVDPVEGHLAVELKQKYEITAVKMLVGAQKGKNTKKSVEEITKMLKNLLSKEGLLKTKAELPTNQYVLDKFDSVFSSIGGTWQSDVDLGAFVKKGDLIGILLNPESGEKQEIFSAINGKVTQINEAVKILKHDKLCTILPILEGKESSFMVKEALRVISNSNK